MRINKTVIIALLPVLGMMYSCKSSEVTLKDVREQEVKTRAALQNAENNMLQLVKMKEAYSEDSRDQRIEALEDRMDEIEADIDRLEDVEEKNNQSVTEGVGSAVKSLKNEKAGIKQQIENLKSVKRENWSSSVDMINRHIDQLQEEINVLTANLPVEEI